MQTFVPYPDLQLTVSCLDRQRLGKQRVEAFQILNCLTGNGGKSWVRHPAVKMWRGYEDFLQLYMNQCIQEWIRRGYKNTMKLAVIRKPKPPFWWESEIHATHRALIGLMGSGNILFLLVKIPLFITSLAKASTNSVAR